MRRAAAWLVAVLGASRAFALDGEADAGPAPAPAWPSPLEMTRPIEPSVSPDVLTLKKLADWEALERSKRRVAWTRTLVSAGSGALAVAAGVEAWSARQQMNQAWLDYSAAPTGADQTAKYESWRTARASMLGWGGASLLATAASAWTGLLARAAWRDLPVRPVINLRRTGGRIGVEGTW
jgi:hypothetical protein